jgi:hypothetical protein
VTLRPELRVILDALLERRERALSLNTVAEAIGARAVTHDEIGELLDALESAGHSISLDKTSARESLASVLGSARALRRELGRSPTSDEIAVRSGLSLDAVRLALLYARVLQR